jgi:hypothetical protein
LEAIVVQARAKKGLRGCRSERRVYEKFSP